MRVSICHSLVFPVLWFSKSEKRDEAILKSSKLMKFWNSLSLKFIPEHNFLSRIHTRNVSNIKTKMFTDRCGILTQQLLREQLELLEGKNHHLLVLVFTEEFWIEKRIRRHYSYRSVQTPCYHMYHYHAVWRWVCVHCCHGHLPQEHLHGDAVGCLSVLLDADSSCCNGPYMLAWDSQWLLVGNGSHPNWKIVKLLYPPGQ